MGCPYSHNVGSTVSCGDDGSCCHSLAEVPAAATDADFSCYGRVVNDAATGGPAFTEEQCGLIAETWTKMLPQKTAIGKQVLLLVLTISIGYNF